MPIQIPLTTDPESQFRIKLQDRQIDFRVIFNTRTERWTADISEAGVSLVSGLTLVLGTDILTAYNLNLGFLFMVDTENLHFEADADTLGTRNILVHYTDEEVAAELNG